MSKKLVQNINEEDYHRVLLTDTLPEEVPLFFSNEGLYQWAKRRKRGAAHAFGRDALSTRILDKLLWVENLDPKSEKHKRPLQYTVHKDATKRRALAIPHPRSQMQWARLYELYDQFLVHFCLRSRYSLRSPRRVAHRTYVPNDEQEENKYRLRHLGPDTEDTHSRRRHAASYFATGRFRRVHEYWESEDFLRLEQRYEVLWCQDIANCFGRIYTHAIPWAMRSKESIKRSLARVDNSVGGQIDKVLQAANWGETVGLLVGPEFSRVCAEIVLQDIDLMIDSALRESKVDKQCEIRRYVDDYFVFADNDVIASKASEAIVASLDDYGLSLNEAKTVMLRRPFATKRACAVEEVRMIINEFLKTVSEYGTVDGDEEDGGSRRGIMPRAIQNPRKLKEQVIRQLKAVCKKRGGGFDLIAGYVSAALENRIASLRNDSGECRERARRYGDVYCLLLEINFFLYAVTPTVPLSYSVCNAALLAVDHCQEEGFEVELARVQEIVYRNCQSIISSTLQVVGQGPVPLEVLNMITLLGQLGESHEVSWETVKEWLCGEGARRSLADLDYFSYIVALHYVRDRAGLDDAREEIGEAILQSVKGADKWNVRYSAKYALLVVDALGCPFLPKPLRQQLLQEVSAKLDLSRSPSRQQLTQALVDFESQSWFAEWRRISLFNSLARRRRTPVY